MKAQISIEFIVFVGVLLLITAVASFVAVSNSNDTYKTSIDRDARSIAEFVGTQINIAAEVGDGYSSRFSLPQLLYGGKNYSINGFRREHLSRCS